MNIKRKNTLQNDNKNYSKFENFVLTDWGYLYMIRYIEKRKKWVNIKNKMYPEEKSF